MFTQKKQEEENQVLTLFIVIVYYSILGCYKTTIVINDQLQ